MAKYKIFIPETKVEEVLAFLKGFRGVKIEEDDEHSHAEISIYDWQKKILDKELEFIERNPDKTISLKDIKATGKKYL